MDVKNKNEFWFKRIEQLETLYDIELNDDYAILVCKKNPKNMLKVPKFGDIQKKVSAGWEPVNIKFTGSQEYASVTLQGTGYDVKVHVLKVIIFMKDELLQKIEAAEGAKVDCHHVDCDIDNNNLSNFQLIEHGPHMRLHAELRKLKKLS